MKAILFYHFYAEPSTFYPNSDALIHGQRVNDVCGHFQVKDRLMLKLKTQLTDTFDAYPNPMTRRDHSGVVRTLLVQKILSGRYKINQRGRF